VPDPAFHEKGRFDDDEPALARRHRRRATLPALDDLDAIDGAR
jgi:hypothetical protein